MAVVLSAPFPVPWQQEDEEVEGGDDGCRHVSMTTDILGAMGIGFQGTRVALEDGCYEDGFTGL